jgi:RimJ/RimL family protein N-acetyltransferase
MELSDRDLFLLPRRPHDPMILDWRGDADAESYGRSLADGAWNEMWDRRRRQAFWIMLADRVIGEVEIFDMRRGERTAELRIGIAQRGDLGQGYGRRALRLVLRYAREHLRLKEAYLRVEERNQRAVACYRAVGFRAVGRLAGRRFPQPVLLMTCDLGDERLLERLARGSEVEGARRPLAGGDLLVQQPEVLVVE